MSKTIAVLTDECNERCYSYSSCKGIQRRKITLHLILIIIFVLGLSISACDDAEEAKPPGQEKSEKAAPKEIAALQSSSTEKPSTPPVVTLDGVPITVAEIDREIARLPRGLQTRYKDAKERRKFISQIIDRKLLLQASRQRGFDRDQALRAKVDGLERRLLIDAVNRAIAAEAVSDETVRKYYDQNLDRFTDERVRVRHILVKQEGTARDVLRQLREGTDFIEMARTKSIDSTARKGGDLGYVPKGRMDPAFETAAFALSERGAISDVVRTRFGYHIIQLVDPPTSTTRPFKQVKYSIRRQLQKEAVENYVRKLRSSAEIKFVDRDENDGR